MLDRLDYDHDRRVAKRTHPVVLGSVRAQRIAWGLIGACLVVLLGSSLFGALPMVAALTGVVPDSVTSGCLVRPPDPNRLVALYIGVTYVFAAALFIAIRIDSWG